MKNRFILCFTLSALAGAAPSQQIGGPQRNYTINTFGSNQPSYVSTSVAVGSQVSNNYTTQTPNAPVAWAASTQATPGWFLTATNSVDLGPGNLFFIANGADPVDPFAPLFRTNASGVLNFQAPTSTSLNGTAYYFAMAHQAASSPDGFYVSQTHVVSFLPDPNLSPGNPTPNASATPLVLSDDSSIQVTLGFSYSFYGTSYQTGFVGSNGYVTFVTGDSSLGENVTTFLTGTRPRISLWWDDLNPATGGQVVYYTDNTSFFEVSWVNVPEYFNSGQNSGKITAVQGVFVSFDYGAFSAVDGLVGLSPGSSLGTGVPLNLSYGAGVLPAGQVSAPYELFTVASPNDLANRQVTFAMDAAGNPTTQF